MEITYENCEVLTIPKELQKQFIAFIELKGISTDYVYSKYDTFYFKTVNEATIRIERLHSLIDKLYNKPEEFIIPNNHESNYKHIFDLLVNRYDITQLTVDGHDYYMPYDDHSTSREFNDDPINYCQSNEYSPNLDQLVITFSKKESE